MKWNDLIKGDYQEFIVVWSDPWKRGTEGEDQFWGRFFSALIKSDDQRGSFLVGDSWEWEEQDPAVAMAARYDAGTARRVFYFGPVGLSWSISRIPTHDWSEDEGDSDFYFDVRMPSTIWELYYDGKSGRIEKVWERDPYY